MRIAIVHEHADPRRGGAEASTLEMAVALANAGMDVTLLATGVAESPHPRVHMAPIPVRAATRLGRTIAYLRGVHAHLDANQYDVVHAITPHPRADIYQPRGGTYRETIRRSLALRQQPLLQKWHALGKLLNVRQQYLKRVEETMLRSPRPPLVAALSAYVARQIRDICPDLPADRLAVVFNGINTSRLLAASDPLHDAAISAAPTILFVAHNFRLKGLRELLCALPRMQTQTARLVVLGRDRAAPWQRLAARLGLGSRVEFRAGEHVPTWLRRAAVLAHPTWYDPCSRVVLEAAACGLRVVTTCWNGAADILDPLENRVLATPADLTGLANALDELIAKSTRDGPLPTASLQPLLDMSRHAAELISLYRRNLGEADTLPARSAHGQIHHSATQ